MNCAACAAPLPPEARFCPECGTSVTGSCASCGHPLGAGHRFCSACGTPAGEVGSRPAGRLPQEGAPRSERRVSSVLFGDLVGLHDAVGEARSRGGPRPALGATSTAAARWSPATAERSRSSSATPSWRSGVCLWRTRTTPSAPSGPGSTSSRRSPTSAERRAPTAWPCGSASSPARSPSPWAPPSRAWSPATPSTPRPGCRRRPSLARCGWTSRPGRSPPQPSPTSLTGCTR